MGSDLVWEVRVQAGRKDVPIEGQPGMGPHLRRGGHSCEGRPWLEELGPQWVRRSGLRWSVKCKVKVVLFLWATPVSFN